MPIEGDTVGICHKSGVVIETLEALMIGDDGALALAKPAGLTYGVINGLIAKQRVSFSETIWARGRNAQSVQRRSANERTAPRFVEDSKHHDDVLVLWLGDELCDDPDVV